MRNSSTWPGPSPAFRGTLPATGIGSPRKFPFDNLTWCQREEKVSWKALGKVLWGLATGQGALSQAAPSCLCDSQGGWFVRTGLSSPLFAISFQLLIPHIRFTLHINTLARELLIAPGKLVDKVGAAFGRLGTLQLEGGGGLGWAWPLLP